MKISLNWLKDYVDIKVSPRELAHRLTMAGLEVEKISSARGDSIFELEITPNRPDCLSVLGVAREVAAVLGRSRKKLPTGSARRPKSRCSVTIEDGKACSRYIGAVVEGVKVKGADPEMAKRIQSLGVRTINNIVDITNFCMMETGQPLHAFDFDKLAGGKIIVRRARKGEKITTIDDVERELDSSVLVIADAEKPVAIAGIMGGKDSEVTDSTRNILLESACFDPVLIRRASRRLGLSSDSSYRFERGVDFGNVETGARRALQLIAKSTGGTLTKFNDKSAVKKSQAKRGIVLSKNWVNHYAGSSLTLSQMKNILKRLDFKVESKGTDSLKVTAPEFRRDVARAEDVVEEIARIVGYDKLNSGFPRVPVTKIKDDARVVARRNIRGTALSQGLNEVICYTMINRADLKRSGQGGIKCLEIFNPLTQDQEIMRPTLLPGFLAVVRANINRGQRDLKIFEIGKIYGANGERDVLGALMTGQRYERWVEADDSARAKKETVDYYDIKGAVEQILKRNGLEEKQIRFEKAAEPHFVSGQSATIAIDDRAAGSIGKVDPSILDQWAIKQEDIYFAQIDLDGIYKATKRQAKYRPVSEFPAVNRDISLAVKTDIPARDIEESVRRSVKGSDNVKLADIRFAELYKGKKIPQGHRGMVFSLTYQSKLARTLRDEEVEQAHNIVCQRLVDDFKALIR